MPTKRLALVACLSLLAACSPHAADSTVDTAPDVAIADAPGTTADAAVATLPDSVDTLEQARAKAGCAVPDDVYFLEDIQIYCSMPADVQAFLARENTCQHFAGEEPYDDERRRELDAANAEFCEGREKNFDDLVARHRDDCTIRQALIEVNQRYDLSFDPDLQPCKA